MAAVKWFLNANESLERNSSSIKFLIFPLSVSPSTDITTCFKRVVISESTSLLNFFKLLISASIALSSLLSNSLYLIWRFDDGNVNSNSLTPFVYLEKSSSLCSNWVKSILSSFFALQEGQFTYIL